MELIKITAAERVPSTNLLDCEIVVDLNGVETSLPYSYDPTEDFGINGEVAAWLAANPLFPIRDAVFSYPHYRLFKSDFVRRLSGTEAGTFMSLLEGEEPWVRLLFNSVDYFQSDDALVTYLHMSLSAAFGEGRASELLAAA